MEFEGSAGIGTDLFPKIRLRTLALCGLAQILHKMANDIRLLQHLKEIEEPFEKDQIGSSAMAYKRNPMRCERLTSLCSYIISLNQSPAMTAASSGSNARSTIRRTSGSRFPKRSWPPTPRSLSRRISATVLSYIRKSSSAISMKSCRSWPPRTSLWRLSRHGGDRQELHERIRVHSMEAAKRVKLEGKSNDLLDRIAGDPQVTP